MCQQCTWTEGVGYSNCNKPRSIPITGGEGIVAPLEEGVLEQPPTPPPSGPAAPLQDGGVLQQPPSQGAAPPLTRGQSILPQDGVLQQPPADGATQPQDVEEEPLCPEGQVLDETTGICEPEEPEAAEEPEQTESDEEEQLAEGDGSEDNNSNN